MTAEAMNSSRELIDREPDHGQYARKHSADYAEILRLYRKYSTHSREPLHEVFIRIGQDIETVRNRSSRRQDLAKMLKAWKFWDEMDSGSQKELLDCIEYTYLKP